MIIANVPMNLDIKKHLRYYDLESYLFGEVHGHFKSLGTLTDEEFFAIVIWKSNRSKTKVRDGIAESKTSIRSLMCRVADATDPKTKIQILDDIDGIGLPIASAILAVCYPDEFTIVDIRAKKALKEIAEEDEVKKIIGDPSASIDAYLEYIQLCKDLAIRYSVTLRDFDRFLWGKDFYEGEGGLQELARSTALLKSTAI